MRLCPWLQALCGRWRKRAALPKQTVDYFPTPKLEPTRIISLERMRQLQRGIRAGRPGTTMVMRDGTEYVVQKDGSWKRNDAARRN